MIATLKNWLRPMVRAWRGAGPAVQTAGSINDPNWIERKANKLARIRPLLQTERPHKVTPTSFDFLTPQLRKQFNIVETTNVSQNGYDETACGLIAQHQQGLILDCGAGLRTEYFDNVVNFEIAAYPSTDVCGVAEQLPFVDQAFEAVFSLAVLEHVRDPFAAARELVRVLKPGGTLYCVVPFLQPLHGYPHHYFNMTHTGLRSLFERDLRIATHTVIPSGLPIWSLTWIVRRWAAQLPAATREEFLRMPLRDLLAEPVSFLQHPFVTQLPPAGNLELASTTALIARKVA
jgi:SAM-dependent methyltransferase